MYGRQIKLCRFLFTYLANLCVGANVLFITGLIDSFYLCVFTYILSFVAVSFTFIGENVKSFSSIIYIFASNRLAKCCCQSAASPQHG